MVRLEHLRVNGLSDEQYRIEKMIKGQNGFTLMDALLELIDNFIDAGAKIIELTFENGNLKITYNNGTAMNEKELLAYYTLDSQNKRYNIEDKGQMGIGGTEANARLSGPEGKHYLYNKHESKDAECIVTDYDMLLKSSHKDCWSKCDGIYGKKITEEDKKNIKAGVTT